MKIIQENENKLSLEVNLIKNIDFLSLHIWITLILIVSFLHFKSLFFLIISYFVFMVIFFVPGYLWFLFFPIKVNVNKEQNIIELQNITFSGSNNPQYSRYFFDLRPIKIPLSSLKSIEFNKSAPNIWSAIPLWYNPGITFYLENNESVTIVGYLFAFPSFEKLGQKISDFTGVKFTK